MNRPTSASASRTPDDFMPPPDARPPRGFKNSLRAMPSSLFLRDDTRPPSRATTASSKRNNDKPKVRKGLANIFSRNTAAIKLEPPPVATTTIHHETTFARHGSCSLRPENKQRPSCGPDPFLRSTEGVRVISPPKQEPCLEAKEIGAERRAGSVTHVGDDSFGSSWVESEYHYDVPLSADEHQQPWLRQPSPVPPQDVPNHCATVGHSFDPYKLQLPLAEEHVDIPADLPAIPQRTLQKDKTRSRIWGILGKAKKKAKGGRADGMDHDTPTPSFPATLRGTRPVTPSSLSGSDTLAEALYAPALYVTKPSTSPTRLPVRDNASPFVHRTLGTSNDCSHKLLKPEDALLNDRFSERKPVHKRKSIGDLFGITLKKSIDKLRAQPKRSSVIVTPQKRRPPSSARSFVEATCGAPDGFSFDDNDASPDTVAFYSRFGNSAFNPEGCHQCPDVTVDDVAMATSYLTRLVNTIPSPSSSKRAKILGAVPSSPTPIRKMRSTLLPSSGRLHVSGRGTKSATNSPSETVHANPNRILFHDDPVTPTTAKETSPVKSLVKKGMRNIFAPQEPLPQPPAFPSIAIDRAEDIKRRSSLYSLLSVSSAASGENVIQISPPAEAGIGISDQSELECSDDSRPSSPLAHVSPVTRGPRTRLSRPPQPTRYQPRPSYPPQLCLSFESEEENETDLGDFLTSPMGSDNRKSFDFTAELNHLSHGQRASFVEAMELHIARPVTLKSASPRKILSQAPEQVALKDMGSVEALKTPATSEVGSRSPLRRPNGRSPGRFEGQAAFQKFVAQTTRPSHFPNPPPFALPPIPSTAPPAQTKAHPKHTKQGSGFSFLSISSLGAPIDAVSRDYTNYFEKNFSSQGVPSLPPLSVLATLPRAPTQSQYPSFQSVQSAATAGAESVQPFGNHQRDSSIGSLESMLVAEVSTRHSAQRASSRHRRRGSTDSSFGRPDWAVQRRNRSSVESVASFVHIGRPALGDRMFMLDNGVQLDPSAGQESSNGPRRDLSDSQLAVSASNNPNRYSYGSWTSVDESSESGSIFGASEMSARPRVESGFSIKAIRLSTSTTGSSFDMEHDTFAQQRGCGNEGCLDSNCEKTITSSMVLAHEASPFKRAAQPANPRHRPPRLNLSSDHELDLPSLISPTTSSTDGGSLFSFETRGSSFSSFSRSGPSHTRQNMSIASVVQVQPTIREEPSSTSLLSRGTMPLYQPESELERPAAWELELDGGSPGDLPLLKQSFITALPEEHDNQSDNGWSDDEPSSEALHRPSHAEMKSAIERELAESLQNFRPLNEGPLGGVFRHQKPVVRHQKTLNNNRIQASPYAPDAIPPLETRYRNKKSSGADGLAIPVSALLTEFARTPSPALPLKQNRGTEASTTGGTDRDLSRRNLGWIRHKSGSDATKDSVVAISGRPTVTDEADVPPLPFSTRDAGCPSFIAWSPLKPQPKFKGKAAAQPKSESNLFKAAQAGNDTPPAPAKRSLHIRVDSTGSPVNLDYPVANKPMSSLRPNLSSSNVSMSRLTTKSKPSLGTVRDDPKVLRSTKSQLPVASKHTTKTPGAAKAKPKAVVAPASKASMRPLKADKTAYKNKENLGPLKPMHGAPRALRV